MFITFQWVVILFEFIFRSIFSLFFSDSNWDKRIFKIETNGRESVNTLDDVVNNFWRAIQQIPFIIRPDRRNKSRLKKIYMIFKRFCFLYFDRYSGDLNELQRSPLPASMSNLCINKNDTINQKKTRWDRWMMCN